MPLSFPPRSNRKIHVIQILKRTHESHQVRQAHLKTCFKNRCNHYEVKKYSTSHFKQWSCLDKKYPSQFLYTHSPGINRISTELSPVLIRWLKRTKVATISCTKKGKYFATTDAVPAYWNPIPDEAVILDFHSLSRLEAGKFSSWNRL